MNETKKQTKRDSTGLASQCTSFLQFITKQPENYEFSLEELSLKFGFFLSTLTLKILKKEGYMTSSTFWKFLIFLKNLLLEISNTKEEKT
jgi:hypothetical protein